MSDMNSKRRITIERTYEASLKDVWDMWTTKEGIESWWGPDGFTTKVLKLDLRPGGGLLYAMTATGPDQVEFMKNAGMPLTTEGRITYSEVVTQRRLAYTHLVDFIPGVEPYDVATLVEFRSIGKDVRMVLTFDSMHDEEWTQRSVMGHESQLGKLEKVIRGLAIE
ncbi:MAG: Aha1 protein [Pedosphaera sp.]|nr:Aha1 protein [Pedosphaera sp.]